MFNISEQLNGSFEELMVEIRGMRKELERVRKALKSQQEPGGPAPAAMKPARGARTKHAASRARTTAA